MRQASKHSIACDVLSWYWVTPCSWNVTRFCVSSNLTSLIHLCGKSLKLAGNANICPQLIPKSNILKTLSFSEIALRKDASHTEECFSGRSSFQYIFFKGACCISPSRKETGNELYRFDRLNQNIPLINQTPSLHHHTRTTVKPLTFTSSNAFHPTVLAPVFIFLRKNNNLIMS